QGRRELRAMEDLVRVRVADSREQPRVGERALQRVVLAPQRGLELAERAVERLDPSATELVERPCQMDRGAFLGRDLGQQQGAGGKVERRKPHLARSLR